MGLFDFLKGGNDKLGIDLSDIKFISDNHIRYENGKNVSGNNKNCWRGLRVQNNSSDGQGYTVTVYNLDGNHSLWGNNIQVSPKRMKVIEKDNSVIRLKGYGTDQMGASFADYGLTLHLNNNTIEKSTLHLYDRGIDIVYLKADPVGFQRTQAISTPSTNIGEVMALSEIICNCQGLAMLNHVYDQKGNYNHPQICYDFGMKFLIEGDKINAKKALAQGAVYGLQFPCSLYNDAFVDSIGQCFSHLMRFFLTTNHTETVKMTALGYLYLSRCIELHPREAHDSYRTRALLFEEHENPMAVKSLIIENIGMSVLAEPFIVSDFYFASQATDSPHQDALLSAIRIHQDLEDTTIGGKDADDYSLDEMALFGEKRHLVLFKTLEQKYKNGLFNLTIGEFKSAIGV